MTKATIPEKIITLLRNQPQTAEDLCLSIYGVYDECARNSFHVHMNKAKRIALISSERLHDNRRAPGESAVRYYLKEIAIDLE